MAMVITIHKLSQEDANFIMANLPDKVQDQSMRVAFTDEYGIVESNRNKIDKKTIAQMNRVYFLIKVDSLDYLLAKIDPTPANIVLSYFRISSMHRKAVVCLKELIEQELLPMCKKIGKRITASLNKRSLQNFKELKRIGVDGANINIRNEDHSFPDVVVEIN